MPSKRVMVSSCPDMDIRGVRRVKDTFSGSFYLDGVFVGFIRGREGAEPSIEWQDDAAKAREKFNAWMAGVPFSEGQVLLGVYQGVAAKLDAHKAYGKLVKKAQAGQTLYRLPTDKPGKIRIYPLPPEHPAVKREMPADAIVLNALLLAGKPLGDGFPAP